MNLCSHESDAVSLAQAQVHTAYYAALVNGQPNEQEFFYQQLHMGKFGRVMVFDKDDLQENCSIVAALLHSPIT